MSKKSKTETKPWAQAQPYLLGAANNLQETYNANAGNIQKATDSVVGLLPSMIDKYKAGDAGVNAARDYNVDILSGKYLNQGNPYLDGIINRSIGDSTNATQAALGLKGLTGGSSYADIISKNAGNIALDARYSDYNNERSRMATAAGQAPGLAAADIMQVAPMLSTLQASTTPVDAAGSYAGSLGGLFSGYSTTTQKKSPWDLIMQAAGNAAGAYAASERRVKRGIEKLDERPDGLGVYRYNYIWDPADAQPRYGVMVDEVERLRPHALGPIVDGIQTVDYSKLEDA